jgi:hypothetical protein
VTPPIVLAALVLVQWGALLAFALTVRHNGWLYYQGGDQTFYYTASSVLAGGHIPDAQIGYGWSYLLSPIARIAGENYLEALPALVLLQTLVLVPVPLCCVYSIAASIGGRLVGYIAGGLWVATPFAVIPLWDSGYRETYTELFLPQAFGLTGLADFPSLVCLLVAAALCCRALDAPRSVDCVVAGIVAGFALGIKPANALFLAGPLLAFSAARRYRAGLEFGLGLLPCVLALALWKYRGLGELPIAAPANAGAGAALAAMPVGLALGPHLELDWSRLGKAYTDLREVLWATPLLQALPLLGLVAAVRRSLPKALLLGGWLGAFLLAKGSSDQASVEDGSFFRLFMPGFPPLLILVALIALFVPRLRQEPVPPSPVRARAVVVVVGALALVPLVLFAALPTVGRDQALFYFGQHVMLPVNGGFHVDVERSGANAAVSWRPQPSAAGVRTFYRVFRSPPLVANPPTGPPPEREGIRCLDASADDYAGAADCRLEMTPVGETRSTRFVDTPPPGRWIYRVGLAANWRGDPRAGDVLLISEAAGP